MAAGDADTCRGEHFASADRERRTERLLDPEGNRVGLVGVADLVQQNRKLVSAQSRQRVAAARQDSRRRDTAVKQLVAHHMPQAVVDDLEAVEIQIQGCERARASLLPEFFEAPPECLDEHSAITQTGQAIERSGTLQSTGGKVRSVASVSDPAIRTAPSRDPHGDTAAEESPVTAILVPDAMRKLKMVYRPRQVRVEHCFQLGDVVGVYPLEPLCNRTHAGGRSHSEHRPPSPGGVELFAAEVPFPQAVGRALGGQFESLLASFQGQLDARQLGDVVPKQRHPVNHRNHLDVQHSTTNRGWQDDGARWTASQGIGDESWQRVFANVGNAANSGWPSTR